METIESLTKQVASKPNAQTLNKLGQLYESSRKLQEAIDCYTKSLTYAKNPIILNQVGVCYFDMNRYNEALTVFKQIIEMKQIGDVHRNISTCYLRLKKYKKAEKHAVLAYNLEPSHANKAILGSLYYILKRYDQSIEMYKTIKSDDLYDLSFPYLGKRDFKMGFHYYEHRLKQNRVYPQTQLLERVEVPQLQLWKGEDCSRLVIIYEQGIGDNIQYFRFILQLARQYPAMKIGYFCNNTVAHLFEHDLPNLNIVHELVFAEYDYKMYIMSIPSILQLEDITPNVDSYIKTDPLKLKEWEQRLSPLQKFRIGFTYNGLLNTFIEKYIPLSTFLELCELDIELICIHKQKDIPTIPNCPSNFHFFDIDEKPFVDTVHILQNIDLLITVDTFIVHLAGVLNVKTWLLLGKYSEWRWSVDTCYWYHSVEIVRNNTESLEEIMPHVKKKLAHYLQSFQ